MPELLESLVSVITTKVLSNNCYIDAKEYIFETVIRFFMNNEVIFTVDEYKLIMSEFLLQVQHDNIAAGREWNIQYPNFDTSTMEEINRSVIECRELVPDLTRRLKELNNFAGKFKDFEDQISKVTRIRDLARNLGQLLPRQTPGGAPSNNHCRNVGAFTLWLDNKARLFVWRGVGQEPHKEEFEYLPRLRAFVDYESRRAPNP